MYPDFVTLMYEEYETTAIAASYMYIQLNLVILKSKGPAVNIRHIRSLI